MGRKAALALSAALLMGVGVGAARAEEGMWTFDNVPRERMQADIGWAPDQAWLDRVMAASGRIPGCSASLVSPEGLALTNYHCVDNCVYDLSRGDVNYQRDGFYAATREEEKACTDFSMIVLQEITDVTADIDRATMGATPEAFAGARDGEIARLESACAQAGGADARCEVVTLYQGGRYALYRYKRYGDVRLVFSPEEEAAYFGFPPDNFNFPRFGADFAFLRVYENGAPAQTPNHLSMHFEPLTEGQPTLISGHPGRTSRLLPTAQLAFQRDYFLPMRIADLSDWRGRLISYGQRGEAETSLVSEALHSTENALKVFWGRRQALVDEAAFARMIAAEQDLQARVARNRAAQREIGDAWGEVASAQAKGRASYLRLEYLETRAGNGSSLLRWARDIVRGAEERGKDNGARLPEYTDSRIGAVAQRVRAERTIEPELERLQLEFWLSVLRERLTMDDPAVQHVLGRESPEGLARRLVEGTRLGDASVRAALWDGGAQAVAASDDPLIVFVRAWDADARAVRALDQREVEGPMARARERIARARFRAFGANAYPDATFTLRLTYGRVAGWTEPDGRVIEPFTQISGLGRRATGAAPFKMAPRWSAAFDTLDPQAIYNVSTTHDVIGGYSGSPLLDTDGRVVGAAFDGNIHALGGEYFYDGALNRTVSVSATAIQLALRDVYHADALLAELGGT